jgi:hypothetical protein
MLDTTSSFIDIFNAQTPLSIRGDKLALTVAAAALSPRLRVNGVVKALILTRRVLPADLFFFGACNERRDQAHPKSRVSRRRTGDTLSSGNQSRAERDVDCR